jgi:hypothetical protein
MEGYMRNPREPLLKTVKIVDLRPTQITVGMREVKEKQKRWREQHGKDAAKFLGSHMISSHSWSKRPTLRY